MIGLRFPLIQRSLISLLLLTPISSVSPMEITPKVRISKRQGINRFFPLFTRLLQTKMGIERRNGCVQIRKEKEIG